MQPFDIKSLLEAQRSFFRTGKTLPVEFRLKQLHKLKTILLANESELVAALKVDLHRPTFETAIFEIKYLIAEINYALKHLNKWLRPKKVAVAFPALSPGRAEISLEPYGNTLIIAAWNYPIVVLLSPLIGAIAAGNCAIVKPSEVAVKTQQVLLKLINENFPADYIVAIDAGPEQMQDVLAQEFDYIFFTGSTQVGKIVMQAAAKTLTPVTLELGGKTPCIVDESADIATAARRIIWSKMINSGQTCIAPDYVYVHKAREQELIREMQIIIEKFFTTQPQLSESFSRIINENHFERLEQLLQEGNVVAGGQTDKRELYIAPTLIRNVTWDDSIMKKEIFGPILPILTFDDIDQVISAINSNPKPLSLYFFTTNKTSERKVIDRTSFGGGCINDCISQYVNIFLPFGGIGFSGVGSYHGRYSFETFSHAKGIYKKRTRFDWFAKFPPYTALKLRILKWFLRF